MSIHIENLQKTVGQFYPDVIRVGDTTLRFTKKVANSEFAVCFMDAPRELPSTSKELEYYTERTIGPTYFNQPKSLQWNHYLYFIVENLVDDKVLHSKALIEKDPIYARKFVLDEKALTTFLHPIVIQEKDNTERVDIAVKWISILRQSHLVEAVFGTYSMPDRLRLMVGDKSPTDQLASPSDPVISTGHLPPIDNFMMTEYRPCLRGMDFNFRDVNLLFGANGAGKTSALEAIELYYCGKRTRRNKDVAEEYSFDVQLLGQQPERVSHEREESDFRDRNLLWYGVREQRTNNLCDSFGRFNFLNTDAAVSLANPGTKEQGINDLLSLLLIGPETADVWQVIEKLSETVVAELRKADKEQEQIVQILASENKRIEEYSSIKTESTSLSTAFKEVLRRNQWTVGENDLEESAGIVIQDISGLEGVAQQAVELAWIDAPVTLGKCEQYYGNIHEFLERHVKSIEALENLKARREQLKEEASRLQNSATLTEELDRLIGAEVEPRASDLETQRGIETEMAKLLAGLGDETLAFATNAPQDLSIKEWKDATTQLNEASESALKDAEHEYKEFIKIRDRSVALGQELRRLASEIIGDGVADECPLCHTRFAPDELVSRIAIGVDTQVEEAAQKLLSQVDHLRRDHQKAIATESAIDRIIKYCGTVGLLTTVTAETVLSKIASSQSTLNKAQKRAHDLHAEIQSLESKGISTERLREVKSQLRSLTFTNSYQSRDDVNELRRLIKIISLAQLASADEAIGPLEATIESALLPWSTKLKEPRRALAELEERRVTTQDIHSRLIQYSSSYPWPNSRPIGEWIVEAESVGGIAVKLQKALSSERAASNSISETIQLRDNQEVIKRQQDDRIARLDEASTALQKIRKNYSLEIATQDALQQNREVIEKIFAHIHSPAEFSAVDIDGSVWKLNRKGTDEQASLSQISTGQRAAFALSVFLAQNAQLKDGPPVILIDDPIAHVDDLNSLAFLDYLREVAISGKRQIFFATASEKLASLFERKFDFLGERFKRFDLTPEHRV